MIAKKFKILSKKIYKKTEKSYVFTASKLSKKEVFSIPNSQIINFQQIVISNPYTNDNEHWLDMSVTGWIFSKIQKELEHYKRTSEVVVDDETHFGINWNYVIMKRRNIENCLFCHININSTNKTKDHLIAKSILRAYGHKSGLSNNTVPCCRSCNVEKANLHPEVYRELVKRKISETGDSKYRIIIFTLDQVLKIKP